MRHIALTISLVATSLAFSATTASAFCGFYVSDSNKNLFNNATQVALMRDGTRTVLSMQNNYEGPPDRFAMVVPVPVVLQKENVKTLPRALFDKLEQLDAPRLVEYWEQDPCKVPPPPTAIGGGPARLRAAGHGSGGTGDLGVTIEAQFSVGEYEIVILSAADSGGLETWLRREKYSIPDGAEPFLRPYVQSGSKFFVAKVDPSKVTFERGSAALSPLRFWYDTPTLALPIRLGLLNAKDQQDLIVHILAKGQRYEVANYENVSIPTNLDVDASAKDDFGSVYNALFDDTVREHPHAVVTEYAWDAGSCDPCPGPSLSSADIATLGGDVSPDAQTIEPRRRGYAWRANNYVITRLHARYAKGTVGDDLVFRAAPPIVGGREMRAFGASLEQTATPSSFNNFQARYAIRHPWTGAIACEHPVRDVWGGPPDGQAYQSARAATNLAFADRSASKLSSFVKFHTGPTAPVASSTTPGTSSSAPSTPSASSASSTPSKGACGCELTPSRAPATLVVISSLFALVGIVRRRRS